MRRLRIHLILVFALAAGACMQVRTNVVAACDVTSPADRVRALAPDDFQFSHTSEAVALRREIPLPSLTAGYTQDQVSCLVAHGDQLAVLMLASRLDAEGRAGDAETALINALPSRDLQLSASEEQSCGDPGKIEYFSCAAGLPENWLLLGDLILKRASDRRDLERAEDAYRRSAEIDFFVRDSGVLAERLSRVRSAELRLSGDGQ